MPITFNRAAQVALCLCIFSTAHATGVLPDTSVVLVNEADGEKALGVKNTDENPVLLYANLKAVPEDSGNFLIVTPPVSRVEPGQTQQLRFILNTGTPLQVEHLMRVVLQGIPPVRSGENRIQTVIRHNLPVIVHPAKLEPNTRPWEMLQWAIQNQTLVVRNPSPYVVRLAQKVQLLPQDMTVALPKPYILPGEALSVKAKEAIADSRRVRLYPASAYGFSVDTYDAPLMAPSTDTRQQSDDHVRP